MKKLLANRIFEYQEVLEIISEHLASVANLHEFCKEHSLNYNTLLLIKNNYKKQYPNVVARLLEIFDYKVQVFTAFKFVEDKAI